MDGSLPTRVAPCGHFIPVGSEDCPLCLLECGVSGQLGYNDVDGGQSDLGDFGVFELLEKIGAGGMGVVYRAWHRGLDCQVAVKILHGAATRELAERFRFEIRALARMNHENIVHIREHGEIDGRFYFSMDWIAGRNLGQILAASGPMAPDRAAETVLAMARAVDHAHSRGVLHRDLKPENILVDTQGKAWLTDFGIARFLEETMGGISRDDHLIGTLRYMAPEQVAPERGVIDRATDVYGLGAVLYSLLTNRPPFEGGPTQVIQGVLERQPEEPCRLAPGVPLDLQSVCLKCLEKDPRRRYSNAGELVDDLERFLHKRPVVARPISRAERTWRWCRRRPAMASLLGLTLALGALTFALLIATLRERDRQTTSQRERLFVEAMALANSESLGQRVESLARLAEAQRLGASEAVRDQILSTLPLVDLLPGTTWTNQNLWYAVYDQNLERRLFAENSNRDEVILESTADGAELCRLTIPESDGALEGFAVGPRGRFALINTRFPDGGRSSTLWRMSDTNRLGSWRRGNHVVPQFSPRGDQFALYDDQRQSVCLYSTADGAQVAILPSTASIQKLVYDPTGRMLLGCSLRHATILIWDFSTGSEVASIEASGRVAGTPCWHPSGRYIAASLEDNRIYLWDLQSGDEVARLSGHSRPASVMFHPRRGFLVSSGEDRTTMIWDAFNERRLLTIPNWTAIQFDRTGGRLNLFAGAVHRIAPFASDRPVRRLRGHFGGDNYAYHLSFSDDGRRLVSAGADGVSLWNVETGDHLQHWPLPDTFNVESLSQGREVIAWRSELGVERFPLSPTETQWDSAAPQGQRIGDWPIDMVEPFGGRLVDVQRQKYLCLGGEGVLQVASWRSAAAPVSITPFQLNGAFAALSSTGAWVVTVMRGANSFEVWSADSGEQTASLEMGTLNRPGVAFDRDDEFLLAGGWNAFRLWRSRPGGAWELEREFPRADGSLFAACAVAPDAGWIAVTPDSRRVDIHAGPSWDRIATLTVPHAAIIRCIRIGPNGRYIAIASEDHTIQLWDLRTVDESLTELGAEPLFE